MTVEERIEMILSKVKESEDNGNVLRSEITGLTAALTELREQNLILMEALADLGGGLI